jgi:Protein of unknown function (DUF1800)/PA14 domain/CHRD domain
MNPVFQARNAKRFALATVVLLLASALQAPAVIIDLNQNGMSDVWALIYGASNLNPSEDTDGDGVSNLRESIAATDPFDPTSVPHITTSILSGTNLTINLPSALGKRYELQSLDLAAEDLGTNWVTEASLIARSGTTVSFAPPASDSSKFFRIAVSDVDSSNSGMNDWEKYQLGLDPLSPFSNGQIDLLGQPISDRAFVTKKLAEQNVITIRATGPSVTQPDPGQTAVDQGQFTVTRGGFPLNAITVNLTPLVGGGAAAVEGTDYLQLPRSVYFPVGKSSALVRLLAVANTNLTTPVAATLQVLSGSGYRLGSAASASIVIYPTATASGTGLTGQYFTNSSATYSSSANFNPANLKMTRVDPTVNFTWGSATTPILNKGSYCVRWTGQVQPQYSETYYFDVNSDEGVKLWVNDQLIIDRWVVQSARDSVGAIAMQGGVRYDIRLEYFNAGGSAGVHLSWYSSSQPKQVIPVTALYPASSPQSAPAVTSPLSAVAFLGQPFTFTVTGANAASYFTSVGVPPGLSLNPTNGVISGVPNQSGDYQVTLTATNTVGVGASVLEIQVLDTGSSVTREVWLGAPGTNVADIPLALSADQTNFLASLEGVTGFGANYAERIRGYFTAPITGNYYFWIAESDSAEVWISNDNQAVNKVRRAYVSPGSSTAPRQWDLQPSQRSGWLDLIAGQPYYLEILHKAGSGANDNWSVGWVQDPTGTNTAPSGVVPGYLLSPYFTPPGSTVPGTLYSANLVGAAGVTSTPVGSATLRLSQDGLQAVLKFNLSGLSSPIIGEHILSDPYLANPNQILFDISAARPQPNGTYLWPIVSVGTLSAADVLEVLNQNKVYLTILTANYPNGELVGHFTLANGTQVFTPPPAPPAWTDDHSDSNAAARFLIQATFGPQASDVAAVQSLGYQGWIDYQMSLVPGHHLPLVLAGKSADPTTPYPSSLTFNTWWRQSVTAPDQLRQRVAFALSEIMVVSEDGVLMNNARALSSYYDLLLDNAFGNYRQLLEAVTLSPAMGLYLNMLGNDKGNMVTGIHANENYAREIMQLFSIGLYRTWPDGTLILDSQGNLVPTYNQNVIMGMASVFTGWSYSQPNQVNGLLPANFSPPANYIDPMVLVPTHHDLGTKLLLDDVMRPQAWGSQANPTSTTFDTYCSQDLEAALDSIFNNQNVGPFICRQLIQRLVTSNPGRDYLYRVVQAFNDNGSHVRGDLAAVIKALLLDYESRSSTMISQPTFGKQREPLLRATAVARALPAPAPSAGTYSQAGTPTITITTTNRHRLNTGDTTFLSFTDNSGQPAPNSQAYAVTVNSPTTFTVNSSGASSCTYIQTANAVVTNQITSRTIVTNAITVTLSGHGLIPGNPVYLVFTSGGTASGLYQVVWTNGKNSMFSVLTADSNATSGKGLVPRLSAGGYTQSRTTLTVSISGPHGLRVGDPVYLKFTSGTAADGQYSVASVPDLSHFTVTAKVSANQTQNGVAVYPLVTPPFVRFGNVAVEENTWNMSSTDGSLAQTPLRSPTVFNYFFPGYQFPGALASAGLTTPEFQLTSDTSVAGQMNVFAGGLLNNAANTNGLSSFSSGNGSVVLDLGPWMTIDYTSNGGIPALINALNSLLTGGQLSPGAKTAIINYVANTSNFPLSSRPTFTQMRDRVRAVVHLLVTSPEFIIQR